MCVIWASTKKHTLTHAYENTDATVVGYLPADISDYVSSFTGVAAALWRIKYDSADLGQEDLEEVEVDDSEHAFRRKVCGTAHAQEGE